MSPFFQLSKLRLKETKNLTLGLTASNQRAESPAQASALRCALSPPAAMSWKGATWKGAGDRKATSCTVTVWLERGDAHRKIPSKSPL